MFYEETNRGWQATKEFTRELRAAEGWPAKWQLIQELKVARVAAQKGYTNGQVEIGIDLNGTPHVTVTFHLQNNVSADAWVDWQKELGNLQGIVEPRLENPLTFTLELGEYYRDKLRATQVARSAAELLHLSTEGKPIKYVAAS
jgi:hypothetical protein